MPIRSLTLEEMLRWVYVEQKANRYLRVAFDWFLQEVNASGLLGDETPRPVVHRDAALVHAAVCELPSVQAHIVLDFAVRDARPERFEEGVIPRPEHVTPMRRLQEYGRAVINGRFEDYLVAIAERIDCPAPLTRVSRRGRVTIVGTEHHAVEIQYCPITWNPDPTFVEATNGTYNAWAAAMAALAMSLAGAKLAAHAVTDLEQWASPQAVAAE
jgi:hypothetical protein